jgi:hypothetical protein
LETRQRRVMVRRNRLHDGRTAETVAGMWMKANHDLRGDYVTVRRKPVKLIYIGDCGW